VTGGSARAATETQPLGSALATPSAPRESVSSSMGTDTTIKLAVLLEELFFIKPLKPEPPAPPPPPVPAEASTETSPKQLPRHWSFSTARLTSSSE
jgi:hypothetical protein